MVGDGLIDLVRIFNESCRPEFDPSANTGLLAVVLRISRMVFAAQVRLSSARAVAPGSIASSHRPPFPDFNLLSQSTSLRLVS